MPPNEPNPARGKWPQALCVATISLSNLISQPESQGAMAAGCQAANNLSWLAALLLRFQRDWQSI